jgi:HutD
VSVRVLEIESLPRQLWDNGLDRTRPVAEKAGLRVSIVEIHAAAPFSAFVGRRRLLIVIGPVGIDLHLDGLRHHVGPGHSIRFDGNADVRVSATAKVTTVLNVIHDDSWSSTSAPDGPDSQRLITVLPQHDPNGEGALIALSEHGAAIRMPIADQSRTTIRPVVTATWLRADHRSKMP